MSDGVQGLEKRKHAGDIPPEIFDEITSEGEVTLCSVMGNDLGDTHYVFYLKDEENLEKPFAFSVTVHPDGKVEFLHFGITEDALLLKKDYQEFLKQLFEEEEK